jgi:Fe-S oxidoreductase
MSLPTGFILGLLADNMRLRRSVLPIPTRKTTAWARGLNLRRGGPTVLYTGQMYQLIPYIERLVEAERRLAGTPLARLTGLGRRVNRIVNVSAFLARPGAPERATYDQVPVDVARLLTDVGVEFGYLYGDDLYSGALAYDLGLDDVVKVQAKRVADAFAKHGVREVITIDPHTTHMLRSVYPELVDGFDVRVRNYLEVLAERKPAVCNPLSGELAIHDSCLFARREDVLTQPRDLLTRAGIAIREPAASGRFTWCCGGPVESLYPDKAVANARRRVAQLREAAAGAVTMCPLCLVNLRKGADSAMSFQDISGCLRRAYTSSTR